MIIELIGISIPNNKSTITRVLGNHGNIAGHTLVRFQVQSYNVPVSVPSISPTYLSHLPIYPTCDYDVLRGPAGLIPRSCHCRYDSEASHAILVYGQGDPEYGDPSVYYCAFNECVTVKSGGSAPISAGYDLSPLAFHPVTRWL